MTERLRADRLLVERGLFDSRARAQAAIEAGLVRANGRAVRKPSQTVSADAKIEAEKAHPYVSRGGLKLAAALDFFGFDPKGRICLDIGASTGGFTDVLLRRGARRVYAVDVGSHQLHDSLRSNPGIVSLEGFDIRNVAAAQLAEPPSLIVVDVSFISLKLALPPALALGATKALLIALIKPQFEAGRVNLKKGIVRDPAVWREVCDDITALVASLGWDVAGVTASPIEGGDGNREFLLGARRG